VEKNIYLGHRRFLNQNQPYRHNKKVFNAKVELDKAPMSLSGKQVYFVVKDINIQLSNKFQKISLTVFGKRNIYFGNFLIGRIWMLDIIWMECTLLIIFVKV
jgi:Transposase family tnp2